MSSPDGMHTLVLSGELDPASTRTFEAEIARLCKNGANGITLDLSRLTYIDSTGVAAIVFVSRLCEMRGYDVALVPGSWFIQRVFALAGVVDRLPFQENGGGAVESSPGAAVLSYRSRLRLRVGRSEHGTNGSAPIRAMAQDGAAELKRAFVFEQFDLDSGSDGVGDVGLRPER